MGPRLKIEPPLVVKRDIESPRLIFRGNAQAHHAVQDLDDHERHHPAIEDRGARADELPPELRPNTDVETDATEHLGGEEAGQDGADEATDGVDTKDVQGVVIAERPLDGAGGDVTADPGGGADRKAHRWGRRYQRPA